MRDAGPELTGWFAGRIPEGWFTGPPEVMSDREEIIVVGTLPGVELGEGTDAAARSAAESARMSRFREESRDARMRIAAEAELRFQREVSWGAACGASRSLFTTISVPVMTRLRQGERAVLDTLVDSGVARSRSDALAWCVRLVGKHQADWIKELRDALVKVEKIRAEGPAAG
jgi:hypothetical protein